MFGGIDFLVLLFIFVGIASGIGRCFLGTLADFIAIFLSLVLASVIYTNPVKLFTRFNITGEAASIVSYVATCFVIFVVLIIIFEALRKKTEIKLFIDRMFGGILGIANGIIIASGFLVIVSSSPNTGKEIDHNKISPYITANIIPKMYESLEKKGIVLPKMIVLPTEYKDEFDSSDRPPQFIKFNFSKLEGSHCIYCGNPVKFMGYFPKYGAALIPKFVCENCKRVSCGCQTYEGFHKLYGKCPVDLAKNGQMFDCGEWPNHLWVCPKGPCPIDNNQIDIWHWKSPVPY